MTTPQTPGGPQACEVPLVEQLESVPRDCRQMIEVGPCHHRNIPYGRLCHEAAARIRELESRAPAPQPEHGILKIRDRDLAEQRKINGAAHERMEEILPLLEGVETFLAKLNESEAAANLGKFIAAARNAKEAILRQDNPPSMRGATGGLEIPPGGFYAE